MTIFLKPKVHLQLKVLYTVAKCYVQLCSCQSCANCKVCPMAFKC